MICWAHRNLGRHCARGENPLARLRGFRKSTILVVTRKIFRSADYNKEGELRSSWYLHLVSPGISPFINCAYQTFYFRPCNVQSLNIHLSTSQKSESSTSVGRISVHEHCAWWFTSLNISRLSHFNPSRASALVYLPNHKVLLDTTRYPRSISLLLPTSIVYTTSTTDGTAHSFRSCLDSPREHRHHFLKVSKDPSPPEHYKGIHDGRHRVGREWAIRAAFPVWLAELQQ